MVSVTPAKYFQADVTFADATVTTATHIMAKAVPSDDWDSDDLADIMVQGDVLVDGTITFTIMRDGPIVGTFDILYIRG